MKEDFGQILLRTSIAALLIFLPMTFNSVVIVDYLYQLI